MLVFGANRENGDMMRINLYGFSVARKGNRNCALRREDVRGDESFAKTLNGYENTKIR